ncbi:MAG: VWA domain-containing protein [Edaphobacter sp.]
MVDRHLIFGFMLLVLPAPIRSGQTSVKPPITDRPYTLSVPVDEVSLIFHASDFHGSPIEDITLSDLRLLDNGKRQRRIVSFEPYQNLPVRAGILFDTSRSMLGYLKENQKTTNLYAAHLLRKDTDSVFVMRFDFEAQVMQKWTNDAGAIAASLRTIAADHASRLGGTAIFDAIYTACRNQWSAEHDMVTGNFLLLFSDGLDNFSHARIRDVIDACQQARTTIYVFSNDPKSRFSQGQKTLNELVKKSGGRIFYDPSGAEIWNDLLIMESDQRNQYRLVYKPSHLKLDGSFHTIKLDSPNRGGVITTRSGYYALH